MRRKIFYNTQAELDGIYYAAKTIDFGVSLSVTLALNELYTAHMMLRERRDVYRHGLKQAANDAVRRAGMCRERMYDEMSSRKFFDVFSDRVVDEAEKDVTIFRLSLKQTLDTNRYPDSQLVAYAETARILLDMAHGHFANMVRIARERFAPYDYAAAFSSFNCADVLAAWGKVCSKLYVSKDNIDLNTEQSLTAFGIIERKLVDGVYLEACMKEAVEAFPEFKNDILVRGESASES